MIVASLVIAFILSKLNHFDPSNSVVSTLILTNTHLSLSLNNFGSTAAAGEAVRSSLAAAFLRIAFVHQHQSLAGEEEPLVRT